MKKITLLATFIKVRWLQKWRSREQLVRYQEKQVKKHLLFLTKNSPYYSKLDGEELQIMTKEQMMHHFDELNTVGVKKKQAFAIAQNGERSRTFNTRYKKISIGLSSGTSGNQGIFLTSKKEQAIWAGTILAKMLPKRNSINHKIAFFLRANNDLYQTVQSKVIQFAYFDMYHSFEQHVQDLNDYQPSILIAPPSVLLQLAKELEKDTLKIHPMQVISVAELLEERDKAYLKERFQLSVIHQIYQCTEGFLGYTCELGALHLNEDHIKFEKKCIDHKRFYPIITDFKRTSQPMIKYCLNDILVRADQPCPCGSLFETIEKIEGREDDIFVFKGKTKNEIHVYPDFIRRCLLFVSEVREYQVCQTAKNQVKIRANHLSSHTKEKIILEFKQLANDQLFEMPELIFEPYKQDPLKKMKRIQRIAE